MGALGVASEVLMGPADSGVAPSTGPGGAHEVHWVLRTETMTQKKH